MKILRNDTTGLEAHQSRLAMSIVGGVFVVVGIGALVITVTKHSSLGSTAVGGILVLAGAAFVLFSSDVHIVADAASQQLRISYKSIVRSRDTVTAYADVQKIAETSTVERDRDSDGNMSTRVRKTVSVMLKNGDMFELPGSSSSNTMSISFFGTQTDIGRALATTMGVPFEELGFSSPTQVINTVTEAIGAVQAIKSQTSPVQPATTPGAQPAAPAQPATPAQPMVAPTASVVPAIPVVVPIPAAALPVDAVVAPATPTATAASTTTPPQVVAVPTVAAQPTPVAAAPVEPTQPQPPTTPPAA